uniref:Uncharacterized protein n=1 Tax=Arundo donax TaxID=35708 RepID=A0A0A9F8L6_ARUDO
MQGLSEQHLQQGNQQALVWTHACTVQAAPLDANAAETKLEADFNFQWCFSVFSLSHPRPRH